MNMYCMKEHGWCAWLISMCSLSVLDEGGSELLRIVMPGSYSASEVIFKVNPSILSWLVLKLFPSNIHRLHSLQCCILGPPPCQDWGIMWRKFISDQSTNREDGFPWWSRKMLIDFSLLYEDWLFRLRHRMKEWRWGGSPSTGRASWRRCLQMPTTLE